MTGLPDLLRDPKGSSPSVSEPAFPDLVYHELRRLASSLLRHERPAHTLQTSALVNEAFLRIAAHSMRQVPSITPLPAIRKNATAWRASIWMPARIN